MHPHKGPREVGTDPPNPLDFPRKDPFREAYLGRWKQLPSIQKVGLIVVLGVWVLLMATVVFAAQRARSLSSLLPVVVVTIVFSLLLLALRRKKQ
jgi:uncharacterized membrane protein SirB2